MSDPSYSEPLAYEPARRNARTSFGKFCLLSLAPRSKVWDTTLGYASIVSYTGCSLVMFGGLFSLIPSMLVSKYILKWPSVVNKLTDGPNQPESLTAIKTLSARAQMARLGSGGPDELAPSLMDSVSLMGQNIPFSGLYSKIFLLAQRIHFYATGRIFADQMSYLGRKKLGIPFGETAFLQVRTCWLDDCVIVFLEKHKDVETNLVVLGAGYDSRCYRFLQKGVSYFEMDAPTTQIAKLQALKKAGISTDGATFVPCDFESQDWMTQLCETSSFDKRKPTFFVWEGVTPYLERSVVVATISEIAHCGKGSVIGFDYFDKSLLTQGMVKAAGKATNERWKFGLSKPEIDELLHECSKVHSNDYDLMILDHLKADELAERYCAKHYDGRSIGYLEDFGGFLLIGA